jgi:hypothetical protein
MSTGVLSVNVWQCVFHQLSSFRDKRMLAQTCRRLRELFRMLQQTRYDFAQNSLVVYQHPMAYGFGDLCMIDFDALVACCLLVAELDMDDHEQATLFYRAGIHSRDILQTRSKVPFCKRFTKRVSPSRKAWDDNSRENNASIVAHQLRDKGQPLRLGYAIHLLAANNWDIVNSMIAAEGDPAFYHFPLVALPRPEPFSD